MDHVNGNIVEHGASGGPLMQNAAIYYLELAGDPELEIKGDKYGG